MGFTHGKAKKAKVTMNLNIWRSKGIGGEWFLCLLLKITRHTDPWPKGERGILEMRRSNMYKL